MENLSIEARTFLKFFFCGNAVLQIYKISYTLIEPWSAVLELFSIAWSSLGFFFSDRVDRGGHEVSIENQTLV